MKPETMTGQNKKRIFLKYTKRSSKHSLGPVTGFRVTKSHRTFINSRFSFSNKRDVSQQFAYRNPETPIIFSVLISILF